ncbi:hypothetical protein P7C73_g155, partial [Tremellales sp. Uapishka_1]
MFHPQRPAPSPPRCGSVRSNISASSSFSSTIPYLPPSHPFSRPFHASESNTSLPLGHPIHNPTYTSYPTYSSASSKSYSSPPSSFTKSPTASLAAPLSPRPKARSYSQPPPPPVDCLSPEKHYSLPTLAILDNKPKQTLLIDLEFIIGKKLHFPFLAKRTSEKKKVRKSKIIKEEDLGWDGIILVEKSSRRGRGVREGNWV